MTDTPHHRKSIRLTEYDYAAEGAYFVTLCAHARACVSGDIVDGEMRLSAWGEIVLEEWLNIPVVRRNVEIHAFVVMPNHVHGIIVINERAWRRQAPTPQARAYGQPLAGSLSTIVGAFKSIVTRRINLLRDTPSTPVWQRNYFEKIIRNEAMLEAVRIYIDQNPVNWAQDENHPSKFNDE